MGTPEAEAAAAAAAEGARADGRTDMGRARGGGVVPDVGMCDLRRSEDEDFCLRGIPLDGPATPGGGAAPGGSGGAGIGGRRSSSLRDREDRRPSEEEDRRIGGADGPGEAPVLPELRRLELEEARPGAGERSRYSELLRRTGIDDDDDVGGVGELWPDFGAYCDCLLAGRVTGGIAADMDLRASSLLCTGTGSDDDDDDDGGCGGCGGGGEAWEDGGRRRKAVRTGGDGLPPEEDATLPLDASAWWWWSPAATCGAGDDASFGMRDTPRSSFGDDGGVAKVAEWDELPELRRERDGPAPGVGDMAGGGARAVVEGAWRGLVGCCRSEVGEGCACARRGRGR